VVEWAAESGGEVTLSFWGGATAPNYGAQLRT
jgi:hypothetical protein